MTFESPVEVHVLAPVSERLWSRKERDDMEEKEGGRPGEQASGSIFNPSLNVSCFWMSSGNVIPFAETFSPSLFRRSNPTRRHGRSPSARLHRGSEAEESGSHSVTHHPTDFSFLLCFTRQTDSWCRHEGKRWRIVCRVMTCGVNIHIQIARFCPTMSRKSPNELGKLFRF